MPSKVDLTDPANPEWTAQDFCAGVWIQGSIRGGAPRLSQVARPPPLCRAEAGRIAAPQPHEGALSSIEGQRMAGAGQCRS